MQAITPVDLSKLIIMPVIGSPFQGGIFAGVVSGEKGQPDYALIHALVDFEIDSTDWKSAIEAAQVPLNGYTDWALPNRREARLLAINTPDSFDKDAWYWTSTQGASYADYAWVQDFGVGYQYCTLKSGQYRARAVRSLIIQ